MNLKPPFLIQKIMLQYLLFFLFVFAHTSKAQNIDSLARQLLSQYPNNTEISLAYYNKGQLHLFGYNKVDTGIHQLNNATSVFEIGSLSKVFTGYLLAEAIANKKLKFNANINHYIPVKFKNKAKISFVQLANHCSGLPKLPNNIFAQFVEHPNNPYQSYSKNDLHDYLKYDAALKNIGQFQYSNLGAALLGYALCKKAKLSYETYLQKSILEPLSMHQTSTNRAKLKEKLVKGLDSKGNRVEYWDFDCMAPAGALLSTAQDMMKFLQFQLSSQSKAVQIQQTVSFEDSSTVSVALSWLVLNKAQKSLLFHNGRTSGFSAAMALNKQDQKAVVVLTNVSGMHSKVAAIDALCLDLVQ